MRSLGHPAQALQKYRTIRRERLNQVGEIFALDDAGILHSFNRVIAEAQGAMLDFRKPSFETAERKRILFAGIDDDDGLRSAKLRAATLGYHRQQGMRNGRGLHGPLKRRRDQSAFARHDPIAW